MGLVKKIQEMKHEMTRWRQKLHAEPELAFEERTTARFLARQLQSFGIEVHSIAKTGVVGVLHGNGKGKAIMLRADMDAIPISEQTGAVHSSRLPGVHHAAGHDGHMAMLLGAAKYLAQTKNFNGTVYFVFQPGEEQGGAQEMIKDGLFQKFPCDEVYAIQNHPELPLGTMLTSSGPQLAASDEFSITFTGTGGDIAQPDKTTNIVGAVTKALSDIQALSDREIAADGTALLAVSSINTNSAISGVLPGEAQLQGCLRTYDPLLHEKIKTGLEDLLQTISLNTGATVTLEFKNSLPALVNGKAETDMALEVAREIVGSQKVAAAAPQQLDADDFACYLQHKPGNLIAIGTGRADGKASPALYSAKYDFNDAALPIGASYWAKLVEKALASPKTAQPKPPAAPNP